MKIYNISQSWYWIDEPLQNFSLHMSRIWSSAGNLTVLWLFAINNQELQDPHNMEEKMVIVHICDIG